MLPRAYITCNCAEIFICWRHWPRQYIEIVQLWLKVGVHDNCAILDISRRHLTGHSSKHLRNFWLFSCKTALALRKKLFCRSWFFFKLPLNQFFIIAKLKHLGHNFCPKCPKLHQFSGDNNESIVTSYWDHHPLATW